MKLVLLDSGIKTRNTRKIFAGTKLVLSELAKASNPNANMEYVDKQLVEADCIILREDCGMGTAATAAEQGGLWDFCLSMRRDLCAHTCGDLIRQLEELGIEIPPQDAVRVTEEGAVVLERNNVMGDGRQAPIIRPVEDGRVTEITREVATLKNDVRYLDASLTVITNFVGLRRDEVVSAATQLLLHGSHVGTGAKAEAGATKNAPRTPQRPSGSRLQQNPLLAHGSIPHWMFTRGRRLLGVSGPAGADAWGDTRGHETMKAEEEEDLVSDTEDEEDDDDTCATKYTGVKLEKASGKYGVKILIKEGGRRKQQRLGAYTSEDEAAFAYAAGVFVLRPRDNIPDMASLSSAEKAMLRGCTKEDLQLLVEARKWWRWRSWREALEGVSSKLKRGRKRGVAIGTSKRRRVVDSNNAAPNEPEVPENAESGETATVTNDNGGGARNTGQEERGEDTAAHEKTACCCVLVCMFDECEVACLHSMTAGAESADSSERSEEDDEEGSDTSASGSHEESGDAATGGKTYGGGCVGTAAPNADMRANREAQDTDVHLGDGRGHVDGHVDRTCGNPLDANGDDVRIPSRVFEQLIQAQDKSAKENARLEALFLNAMSRPSSGSRRRKAQKQRDPGQGCMNPKRQRGETWSGGSDDDGEDDEEGTHGSSGRHMRTAKSPILQRALEHLPTDKAWKVSGHVSVRVQWVCELARVHMFLNRPTSTMTFYPSSDDKTHGVCAVLDRLPHSFACLALAADKSRRADLNKMLSEWKTRAAARVRDIALPKLGMFRDDRDASSPWAPEKERSIEKIRERIGLGADPPGECRRNAMESLTSYSYAPMNAWRTLILTVRMWCAETLVLTSWATDKDGIPFASRAFATCAKAAFKPKKAGLVMTLKVYHLAWLEHVVSDCVLYWEERKGRLSNSAGGNAHVVGGLKVLVKEAVERAIRIRNPEYDAEREAWI
ncbi:unnamed protein product [Closterium sp. Yama58-4]|nr:unnamed protein product [Closterium sp. Yama58-4]